MKSAFAANHTAPATQSPLPGLALTTSLVSPLTRHSLPAFSSAQFAALGTAQHAALGTTQHAALHSARHVALGTAQLVALGTAQLSALSTAQLSALGTTQHAALHATRHGALHSAQHAALKALNTSAIAALGSTQISALEAADVLALKPASSAQAHASALAQAIGRFAQDSQTLATALHFDLSATHAGDAALASGANVSHLASVLQQFDQHGQLWQASTAVVAGNPSSQPFNSLSGLSQRDGGGILAIGK